MCLYHVHRQFMTLLQLFQFSNSSLVRVYRTLDLSFDRMMGGTYIMVHTPLMTLAPHALTSIDDAKNTKTKKKIDIMTGTC